MEKTINLEKLLGNPVVFDNQMRRDAWTKDQVLRSMKEAIRQALELAAENAKTHSTEEYVSAIGGGEWEWFTSIDKQSILNTINQIK